MNDFEVNGVRFKANKMSPMKQFHVARRMGPIMGDLLPVLKTIKSKIDSAGNDDQKLDAISEFIAPIINGVSALSDKDAEFVLLSLVSCCEMEQMGHWAPMGNGEVIFFQTLELPTLLQIAGKAFMYNLSGFFSASLPASPEGKSKAKSR